MFFALKTPPCTTCNRDYDDREHLSLNEEEGQAMRVAGWYVGHPANKYEDMVGAKFAKELDGIVTELLSDPLKYMSLLNIRGREEGNYERLVTKLVAFSSKCKKLKNSVIKVDGRY